MKIVGLVRVSTDGQVGENGEGLERQRLAVQGIADSLGAELIPVEMRGVSGTSVAESSQWTSQVLPELAKGAHIAADALDRIIRPKGFDLQPLEDLQEVGSRIYLPGRVLDPNNDSDEFHLLIHAGIAGRERREILRRMADGKKTKRAAGQWVTRQDLLPKGCTYDKASKSWGYNDCAEDVVQAFNWRIEGISYRQIGIRIECTPQGAKSILANPIYKGWFRAGSCRVYGGPGQPEPLVSDETWKTAQAPAKGTRNWGSAEGGPYSTYLVSEAEGSTDWDGFQLLSLTEDGPQHTVYFNRSRGRYFCRCAGAKAASGTDEWGPQSRCTLGHLNSIQVNLGLGAYLERLTSEPWAIEAIRKTISGGSRDTSKQRERLSKALSKLTRKETRLTDLYLDEELSRTEYDSRKAKVSEQREALETALVDLDETPTLTAGDVDRLAKVWTFDPSWAHERIREWCRQYIRHIGISNSGVESVVIRIPAASGGYPVFGSSGPASWSDLGAKIRVNRRPRKAA